MVEAVLEPLFAGPSTKLFSFHSKVIPLDVHRRAGYLNKRAFQMNVDTGDVPTLQRSYRPRNLVFGQFLTVGCAEKTDHLNEQVRREATLLLGRWTANPCRNGVFESQILGNRHA